MSFLRDLIFSQSQTNEDSSDESDVSTDVDIDNLREINGNGKRYDFGCVLYVLSMLSLFHVE